MYLNQNNANLELTLTTLIERVNHTQEVSLSRMNVTYDYVLFDWHFPEDNIADDTKALSNWIPAQQLRASHDADLVVLLRDFKYDSNDAEGWTADFGLNKDKAYAIVPLDFTGFPSYIFVHEVGHLYGGRHDDFDKEVGITCGQGHNIYGNWHTAVHQTQPRVLHYSNPKVFYNGFRTGVFSSTPSGADGKNNSGRIREIGCEVADYFAGMDMTVWIDGDETICNSPKTYLANVASPNTAGTPGQPPYTYEWYYSFTGLFETSNITQLSSTSSSLVIPPPNVSPCQTFFLHLKVTSSDQFVGKYTKRVKRL